MYVLIYNLLAIKIFALRMSHIYKKVKKEIAKILTSLEKAGGKLQTKAKKRTSKVLVKAERKLAGLTMTGLKGLEKGLRKTRKALKKNLPR